MKIANQYFFEYSLIAATMLLSVSGFWDLYLGAGAAPNPYHHLHVATNFTWLFLLLYQLRLIGTRRFGEHRQVGLAILIVGPFLVATTALLSVHSANRALVSGRPDPLIVQNVMVTLELGVLVFLAFVLRKRRKLHGAFMLSTAILFMGVALFFSLITFVPQFRIEGPETFYRFETAGRTIQAICMVVGGLFFVKDVRNGWPFALAGSCFVLNEWIKAWLTERQLIQPLTELVGSLNQALTAVGSFAILAALLAATGMLRARTGRGMPMSKLGRVPSID